MAHIPTYIAAQGRARAGRLPGPVARGHPRRDATAIIVYQDQVLQIVQRVAGYSSARPTSCAGRWARKITEVMQQRAARVPRRRQGAAATPTETAEKLWEYIEPFAGYAFNKAHAVLLRLDRLPDRLPQGELPGRVDGGRADHRRRRTPTRSSRRSASAAGSASRSWSPNINHSQVRLHRRAGRARRTATRARCGIRFGLAAVKNVGEGAVEAIVAEREQERPVQVARRFLPAGSTCAR